MNETLEKFLSWQTKVFPQSKKYQFMGKVRQQKSTTRVDVRRPGLHSYLLPLSRCVTQAKCSQLGPIFAPLEGFCQYLETFSIIMPGGLLLGSNEQRPERLLNVPQCAGHAHPPGQGIIQLLRIRNFKLRKLIDLFRFWFPHL